MSQYNKLQCFECFKIAKPIGHSEIVTFINCCKNPTVSAC